MKVFGIISVCFILCFRTVDGNAFLKSPTSRSSMWRFFGEAKWNAGNAVLKENNNDMMLNCNGVQTDGDLGGKCGVCGDPVGGPFENEGPYGKYAYRRPSYIYRVGQQINVTVAVTARANGGFYTFKICKTDSSTAATQSCFDQYPLKLANTVDQTLIQVPDVDGDIVVPLQLPSGLQCEFCVMQWVWVTARDWRCEVRKEGKLQCGTGLGEQTTFVNCADIAIIDQTASVPADFHFPAYNSDYASTSGGHAGTGGSHTTPTVPQPGSTVAVDTTQATTPPVVITTPSKIDTTLNTGDITSQAVPTTTPVAIITVTSDTGDGTTQIAPPATTEKLLRPDDDDDDRDSRTIYGRGSSNGLGLGLLAGLGLLTLFNNQGQTAVALLPQPAPIVAPPTVRYYPKPFIGPDPLPQPKVSKKYYSGGYGSSYSSGYGHKNYGYSPYKYPTSNVHSYGSKGKSNFFQMPRNYGGIPRYEYDTEPEVKATMNIKNKTSSNKDAYSLNCAASEQTCTPKYGNQDTLYGSINIFNMICELECMDGNSNCPVDMCSCVCPEDKRKDGNEKSQSIRDALRTVTPPQNSPSNRPQSAFGGGTSSMNGNPRSNNRWQNGNLNYGTNTRSNTPNAPVNRNRSGNFQNNGLGVNGRPQLPGSRGMNANGLAGRWESGSRNMPSQNTGNMWQNG